MLVLGGETMQKALLEPVLELPKPELGALPFRAKLNPVPLTVPFLNVLGVVIIFIVILVLWNLAVTVQATLAVLVVALAYDLLFSILPRRFEDAVFPGLARYKIDARWRKTELARRQQEYARWREGCIRKLDQASQELQRTPIPASMGAMVFDAGVNVTHTTEVPNGYVVYAEDYWKLVASENISPDTGLPVLLKPHPILVHGREVLIGF